MYLIALLMPPIGIVLALMDKAYYGWHHLLPTFALAWAVPGVLYGRALHSTDITSATTMLVIAYVSHFIASVYAVVILRHCELAREEALHADTRKLLLSLLLNLSPKSDEQ